MNSNELTEDQQFDLVRRDPNWIKEIDNPTESIQYYCINHNIGLFPDIKNPTEPVCIEVARRYPYILKYIDEQFKTPNVIFEAVRNNGCVIAYVSNPSHELMKTALDNKGAAILFFPVKNYGEDIELYALERKWHPSVYGHICGENKLQYKSDWFKKQLKLLKLKYGPIPEYEINNDF
ncbi:hypothetical protein PBI_SCTP2_113 [Salicola phage SCTP-2]|nr:hypothetical protein PBI_SCTP2_113 [Salicola phage SCTP-2]